MKQLIIDKGFYITVGRRYNWIKDKYDQKGIGIEKKWFTEREITVTVNNKSYICNMETAKAFINKYKSFEKRGKAKIGYISKSLLLTVEQARLARQKTLF